MDSTTRPIAVLGLGGVGGMIAARTDALAIGTERTVEVVRASGITLVEGDSTAIVPLDAAERLEQPIGLLVIAVKAPALEAALERIAPASVERAVVLPLLNGLEHLATIRAWAAETGSTARVAAGSISRLQAFSPEPGLIIQRRPTPLVTASSDHMPAADLDEALRPLHVPGIEVEIAESEALVLWEKAARLAVLAAATSASGEPVGTLRADASWRRRLDEALVEACAAAAAEGVALEPAAQWAIIDAMPETLTTSTARDVLAGRPSELDAITGSVMRAAARHGIATPALAGLMEDACRPR